MMNDLLNTLNAEQERIASWRHDLHRKPETAFEEQNTASYIAKLLRDWGYEVAEVIERSGVLQGRVP
ncbi:MAG: hypothetical protein ABTR07_12730 [Candidatus Competibacter denitrificans]